MNHTEYMRIWRENNRERYREITNKATAIDQIIGCKIYKRCV